MSDIIAVDPEIWTYNGRSVYFDPATEMGSLTAMWEACGRIETKHPRHWLGQVQTEEVLDALCQKLNVTRNYILETRQGRNGGTWAHWQIATIYAHYLDPRFYLWWNEQARAHIEGEYILTPSKFDDILTDIGLHFRSQEEWSKAIADALFGVRDMLRQEPEPLFGKRPQLGTAILTVPVLDPKKSGWVYLFVDKNSEPPKYKVGQTKGDIQKRARQVEGQTLIELDILKEIQTDDARRLEDVLKRYYQPSRIKKEWFYLSDEQLDLFLALPAYIDARRFDTSVLDVYEQGKLVM